MTDRDPIIGYLMEIKAMGASNTAKLESLEDHVKERMDKQDQRMNGHGGRLRSLEKTSWTRGGAIAVVAAGAAAILSNLKGIWT